MCGWVEDLRFGQIRSLGWSGRAAIKLRLWSSWGEGDEDDEDDDDDDDADNIDDDIADDIADDNADDADADVDDDDADNIADDNDDDDDADDDDAVLHLQDLIRAEVWGWRNEWGSMSAIATPRGIVIQNLNMMPMMTITYWGYGSDHTLIIIIYAYS